MNIDPYVYLEFSADMIEDVALEEPPKPRGFFVEIFDEVIASDGHAILIGWQEAAALTERSGNGGFHYIGHDWSDVPV